MQRIDAIIHTSDINAITEELKQSEPQVANGDARLHYVRVKPDQLASLSEHYTVLAQSQYTGTGTAARLYQQIKDDADLLAMYESVYDTSPRMVDDGEGGTTTVTPPFAFGMLAESAVPVPASVTSRQGMEQLIRLGLDEQVDTAIDEIEDPIQRKIVRNWFEKAGEWERDNPQFVALSEKLGLSAEQSDDYMRQAATL